MTFALQSFLEEQAFGFVLAAAVVCSASGWLLSLLLSRARLAGRTARPWWMLSIAVVTGTGVWTTHFVAMLGYRIDLAIDYDLRRTLASALVATLAVGLPVALSILPRTASARAILGGVAGLGVGIMHLIGMSAVEGCGQTQSMVANGIAFLIGGAAMAFACTRSTGRVAVVTGAIVMAVCGTHFVSIAGTSLEGVPSDRLTSFQFGLSILVTLGAGLLLTATLAALVVVRRFDAQGTAHAAAIAVALQNMSNGLLKISASERVEIFNQRLLGMLRLSPGDVAVDMTLPDFVTNVGRANGWEADRVVRVVENHRAWMAAAGETRIEHNFEDGRILSIACQPVEGGAVLTYDDVTAARVAQREVVHLAHHDPLTGLANRRAFHDHVQTTFARRERYKLLLLDLDRFKAVNDTYGHGIGDRLLREVAERLRAFERDGAYVARIGGDELAVTVTGDAEEALAVANRIVEEIGRPFAMEGFDVRVGCSVGLCCTDDAIDPDHLMQQSDIALYEAKRLGRGRAVCYRPGLREAVAERTALEGDLREAVRNGDFHLAYQPILTLGNETIVGFEALIRWTHAQRGPVPPDKFIPLAEEAGLIGEIGKWVLEEACRAARLWPSHQHVAVNVSPVQFRSASLLAHVTGALASSGLDARRLEVELTETALVEDGQQIAHTLASLRALGIKVAMDDFGTGYSSFAHLRDLPLDRIKIDRSFVAAMLEDRHSLAVVRAVVSMGRDMGVETLAEGVETVEQLDMLRSLGCGAVQGYLIGRPDPRAVVGGFDISVRAA